ncbi:uncharacterized protein LOC116604330 [Nematostella vectensis]|uniref:uncharacterized protein LOC116604330 n=1 Tax=Nematostella vectensis TaxID=45351 RepID=UPI00207754BE|nr:uncharacterized protein LOC116604330 [Nematostella vectensis]
MSEIKKNVWSGTSIRTLELGDNQIVNIEAGALPSSLQVLALPQNRICNIRDGTFDVRLRTNLSDNWFTEVNQTTLVCPPNLEILILSNNNITLLSPESFLHANNLRQLEIAQINVKELDMSIFLQAPPEIEIVLSQMGSSNLIFTVSGMAASQLATEGYICRRGLGLSSCQGCPVGKYMLDNVCKSCPRGGFYQDEIAEFRMNTYGNGCKLCPEGKFSKNPGATSRQDCQGCPLGTKSDFAAFRACSCRDKYYRFDRFGGCFPCPTYYICSNETFTLAPGYYWEWESHKHLEHFESFRWNLNDRSASSDAMTSAFNSAVLPVAYQCPIRESCLGGLHGACSMGYSGPLCAVCSSGYYKHANKCVKCKSLLQWSVGLSLCLCIWVILVIMVWLSIPPPSNKRSVCDIIMANTKIILGFYQLSVESRPLMQGTDLEGPFYTFLSYSNIVQLGFSGTFPLHCLNTDFKFNAATKFAIAVMSNVLVILAGTLMYKVWGWVLTKRKNKESPQRPQASRGKQRIVGITCLLLFVMYPSTCYHIFSVLPLTCQEICTSRSNCESFLVADFTVSCNKPGFTILTVFACVSFLHVLGFPMAVLILLRHKFKAKKRNKVPEIGLGMRFLYEDYKSQYFYWEFLELIRKLVVTAVLVFLGMQSKLTAGIVGIVSGSYAVLYSHVKPAAEPFQHWLQVLSLLVTMVTTQIIVLARIPVVEESLPVDAKADEQGIQGMIFLAKYAGLIVIPAFFVTLTIQLVRRSRHMSWEAPASYD